MSSPARFAEVAPRVRGPLRQSRAVVARVASLTKAAPIRSAGWAASGELAGKCALLLTTVIIARAASPETFGRYVALSAIAMVAAGLWDFGSSTLASKAVAAGEIRARDAIRDVVRLRAIVVPAWVILFAVTTAIVGVSNPRDFIPFAAVSLLFASHAPLLGILRGELRFRTVATLWTVGRFVTCVVTLAFALAPRGLGLQEAGWAGVCGEASTLLLAVAAVLLRSEPAGYRNRRSITFRASLPLAANGVLSLAYNRLDVVLLTALAGADQLDKYGPASRLQDALYVFPYVVTTVALPVLSRRARAEGSAEVVGRAAVRTSVCGFLFGLLAAGALVFAAPRALELVLGAGYRGSAEATRVIVLFLPFSMAVAPLLSALISAGRSIDTSKVFGLSFAVSFSLHVILDPRFGATGGSVATVARDVVAVPFAYLLARRAGLVGPALRRRRLTAAFARGSQVG